MTYVCGMDGITLDVIRAEAQALRSRLEAEFLSSLDRLPRYGRIEGDKRSALAAQVEKNRRAGRSLCYGISNERMARFIESV